MKISPMEYTKACRLSAVILSLGLLARTDNVFLQFASGLMELHRELPNTVSKTEIGGVSKPFGDMVPDTIVQPESVPWLVKILDDNETHLYTGALVTWKIVLTTCSAATNPQIQYVTASFGTLGYQKRSIPKTLADSRCPLHTSNTDMMRRYDIGTITVHSPFFANNYAISVVQFPTLNKRKYLELTDQLAANGIKCRFFEWERDGALKAITITAVQSYRVPSCQKYEGVHELICSVASTNGSNAIGTAEGSPVVCGEDIYGIMPKQAQELLLDMMTSRTVYIWLRLDEFVHLLVDDQPELIEFINNVEY